MKIDRRTFFACLLGLAFVPLRVYAPFVYKRLTGPLESCGLSIPFGVLPINGYILGPRYRITFAGHLVNPKSVKDPVK